MARLMPREEAFFAELAQLAETGAGAARLLREALGDLDPDGARGKRIKELEHQGDQLKDGVMERLDRTFITPIDREDLHDLAVSLDAVLNRIDRIAHRLRLYHVGSVRPGVQELGDLVEKATAAIVEAVRGLGEKGRHAEVLKLCDAIEDVEHDGDDATDRALEQLFRDATDAMEVVKWKDLLEDLEKATDKCKNVADVVRRIVVKNA